MDMTGYKLVCVDVAVSLGVVEWIVFCLVSGEVLSRHLTLETPWYSIYKILQNK
jgi:hypothetical protein